MKKSSNHEAAIYIAWCIVIGISLSIMTLVPKESPISIGFSALFIAAVFYYLFHDVRQYLSETRTKTKKPEEAWRRTPFGIVWAWVEGALAIGSITFVVLVALYLVAQRI